MPTQSYKLRKRIFSLLFFVLVPFCALVHYPIIRGEFAFVISLFGLAIIVASSAFAFYVHSMFPKKHDAPSDFNVLLKDGPYKYVRHPFYLAFIILGYGIALFFLSIPGLVFNTLMIGLWNRLADIEEKELLDYWGDDYREFMRTRGRFLPRIRRDPNSAK